MPSQRSTRAHVVLALATHGVCTLPLILLGTLAVGIRDDLAFNTGAQGMVTSGQVLLAAVATTVAGRHVDGARSVRALALAAWLTAAALIGCALAAQSLSSLLPFMAVGGVALGIVQPATDSFLHSAVPAGRQGSVFSLKQAIAGPGIGLLGGLAVPATAGVGGWRSVFVGGAVLAGITATAATIASVPKQPTHDQEVQVVLRAAGTGRLPRRPLLLLAVAGAVATAPQAAFLGFAVSSATDLGMAQSAVGLIFAASCGVAVAARLLLGRRVDRRRSSLLGIIAGLLLVSVAGFVCLSLGSSPTTSLGMPVVAATAWGWHGLFFLVAVRTSPGAPGRASGYAGAGVLVGAVVGPLLFGRGAEWSYAACWLAAAIWSLAGAGCMLLARRSIVSALVPG
jgi:MFS family permease